MEMFCNFLTLAPGKSCSDGWCNVNVHSWQDLWVAARYMEPSTDTRGGCSGSTDENQEQPSAESTASSSAGREEGCAGAESDQCPVISMVSREEWHARPPKVRPFSTITTVAAHITQKRSTTYNLQRIPKATVQRLLQYRRRIEIPQRTRFFPANCCLKVHNAPSNLESPISG